MHRARIPQMAIVVASLGCHAGDVKTEPTEVSEQASPKVEDSGELHVEVFYRERMMLPPTAVLEVVLEDGAKMDVAAELVAKKSMKLESGPPYLVTLEYDPSELHGRGRYAVRARIENDGQLIFTSTQFNPAFGMHGSIDEPANDPVRVLVSRVAGQKKTSAASITGTRWVFKKLRGEDAGVGAGGKAPHLTLQGAEPRVSGFAGCNQISGGYELKGDELSFSKMAMTARACPEGMDLDRKVAQVLGDTKRYAISGNSLRLMGEDGTVIAELLAE